MKITRKQLRRLINESVRNMLEEEGRSYECPKYGLAPKDYKTKGHPYGYSMWKAKEYTGINNRVVHWIVGEKGAEKIYIIHKDGCSLQGTGQNYSIPSNAEVIYKRDSQ